MKTIVNDEIIPLVFKVQNDPTSIFANDILFPPFTKGERKTVDEPSINISDEV